MSRTERLDHIEQCRNEIKAWSDQMTDALRIAAETGGPLPDDSTPPSVTDAYECVLAGFQEQGVTTNLFDDFPPSALTFASRFLILDQIDLVLRAARKA